MTRKRRKERDWGLILILILFGITFLIAIFRPISQDEARLELYKDTGFAGPYK